MTAIGGMSDGRADRIAGGRAVVMVVKVTAEIIVSCCWRHPGSAGRGERPVTAAWHTLDRGLYGRGAGRAGLEIDWSHRP